MAIDAAGLSRALRDVASDLTALGRSFALVGGLAVSARAEIRFTRDVDLAVAVADDADAERLVLALKGLSYQVRATWLGTVNSCSNHAFVAPGLMISHICDHT